MMEYSSIRPNNATDYALIQEIFEGKLVVSSTDSLNPLKDKALSILEKYFGSDLDLSVSPSHISSFVQKASDTKTEFTSRSDFKSCLREFVGLELRMNPDSFLYDKPRLRIIPTSSKLNSGVSYNYKLHRDTWYGAGIDQINIWFPILNVSKERTFGIAPSLFDQYIPNTSQSFDLELHLW